MSFFERFATIQVRDAQFFAGDLFQVSFRSPFPIPREACGLPIPTPSDNWRQFVGLYKWPDGRLETVGFCNWIKYDTVYLEGGLCVRSSFYRRVPRAEFQECSAAGGVAQVMMEAAAQVLTDCDAWFAYCGDKKAYQAGLRVGYVALHTRYLIARWFRDLPEQRKRELEEQVSAVGPF